MGAFEHPTPAGETAWAPSEPPQGSGPAPPSCRGEAPGQADESLAEWEYLWIDLGGEG